MSIRWRYEQATTGTSGMGWGGLLHRLWHRQRRSGATWRPGSRTFRRPSLPPTGAADGTVRVGPQPVGVHPSRHHCCRNNDRLRLLKQTLLGLSLKGVGAPLTSKYHAVARSRRIGARRSSSDDPKGMASKNGSPASRIRVRRSASRSPLRRTRPQLPSGTGLHRSGSVRRLRHAPASRIGPAVFYRYRRCL